MDWSKVCAHLAPEGSLRDLYVFETSQSDWESFFAALREWPYELSFLVDGELAGLPETANAIFLLRESASVLLRIKVGQFTVCAHFFVTDEVELDVDPREICGPDQLVGLSDFMRRLGDLLNRPVVLTHENTPAERIAQYFPETGAFAYPTSGSKPGAA